MKWLDKAVRFNWFTRKRAQWVDDIWRGYRKQNRAPVGRFEILESRLLLTVLKSFVLTSDPIGRLEVSVQGGERPISITNDGTDVKVCEPAPVGCNSVAHPTQGRNVRVTDLKTVPGDDPASGVSGQGIYLNANGSSLPNSALNLSIAESGAGAVPFKVGSLWVSIRIDPFNGNDTLTGASGPTEFFAGSGDDSILGSREKDRIDAGPGNDTVTPGTGNDFISFGTGVDLLFESRDVNFRINNSSLFVGTTETDTFSATGSPPFDTPDQARLIGGTSGNTITAINPNNSNDFYSRPVTLEGGDGNDNLTGGSANDVLKGGLGDDTLTGGGGSNQLIESSDASSIILSDGSLSGVGNDTLSQIQQANLTGGPSDNTFTISLWTGTATLDGAGGSDTLVGPNQTNTWNLTQTGNNINGPSVLSFANFENLNGGTLNDLFDFSDGVNVPGVINGEGGADTLDYSSYSAANSVLVDLASKALQIEFVLGGLGADTLRGSNSTNAWNLTGLKAGNIGGAAAFQFTEFESLEGGTGNDTFALAAGATFNGPIKGGLGSDTIKADDATNTWMITDNDKGTVNGFPGVFNEVENLVGGSMADSFVFNDGKTISGSIDGGAGTGFDTLNYGNYMAPNTVTVDRNSTAIGIENVIGGQGSSDSLTGRNLADT